MYIYSIYACIYIYICIFIRMLPYVELKEAEPQKARASPSARSARRAAFRADPGSIEARACEAVDFHLHAGRAGAEPLDEGRVCRLRLHFLAAWRGRQALRRRRRLGFFGLGTWMFNLLKGHKYL